ncbi:MAG TPA: hybrid sensor histidine kinase/response regulator [Thermoanaerobaculia bacterium]
MTPNDSERILILTPQGRDGEVACRILDRAGMECVVCADINELCREIPRGAGAVIVATEALPRKAIRELSEVLERQPSWSELPILIFALPGVDRQLPAFGPLEDRHFTTLDRPIGVKALVSAVRTALRWRRRQYEVRNLMDALEARVHERDKFLAILGHELRNPLGAILLASQLHDEDGRLDGEHAAMIERQSRHLTRLVDDLLDLSRVTAGKIVLQRRSVDLNDIVDQTLRTLRESMPSKAVAVEWTRAASAVLVNGDPVRLEQIVSNVVSNALKYTPDGGTVVITVTREDDTALLTVKDDGVGIAKERLDQIFGLFTQAENAIGRAQGGMGIGLSLVRNLVGLHGGTVHASSDGVGKGSEFVVKLPVARSRSTDVSTPTTEVVAEAPSARRVVIIEDNPDIRTLLQLKLRRLGHDVEAVGDGERGIERIVHLEPDLALVDIGLPGVDGYEVAVQVREKLGDNVFLVALSGFGQPEDKRRALEAGFNEHLTKPADVKDLEQLLSRVPRQLR